jgi:WD40 repeat protein
MDGSVRIWQLDTGIAGAVLAGHGDYVNSVAWSPDGSRLVTAGGDALVRVWDAATGRLLAETPAVKFTATAAGFAVGGGGIVTADAAGVHLWNPDTGALIDLLPPPQHLLDSYTAFSPDGRRMVLTPPWDVYSEHLTFRLFDLASRRLLAELPIDSNTAPVFSPDSARVATRQPDETIGIWDVETGRQLLHLPACKWCDIAFSPDGGRLVAGQSGGPALVYDAWTGQLLTTADGQAAGPFSADGRRVFSAGGDGTIHICDAATGVEVGMLKAPAYVHRALVTPDGRFVVGIDMNNEVIRWRYFPDMASLVNYASDLLPREEATHD